MKNKIEYGVAWCHHMSGGGINDIDKQRFGDYDSAYKYACSLEECMPTIYLILNNKYCYYCERSAVINKPYRIYKIEATKDGYIETSIWFKNFKANPKKYINYAVGILSGD